MATAGSWEKRAGVIATLSLLAAIMAALVSSGGHVWLASGQPRLVSARQFPEADGSLCEFLPASASASESLIHALEEESGPENQRTAVERATLATRKPLREVRDPYATYSALAVDPLHNEVVMVDENLYSILSYNRLENTAPKASLSEPKRMIQGLKTELEFPCSVYVDPANGDIYTVNNDTHRKLNIFGYGAKGDAAPLRSINTPMSAYGLAVDPRNQEILISIQDSHSIVTYAKSAKGDDRPIRVLQGEHTGLGDPHGIALDTKNDVIYVTNWGPNGPPFGGNPRASGTGKFLPPSITVYPRTASGDTAPLRVIQGDKTQLDWPTAAAVDPERGELFVVNDPTSSVVVFEADASGNVAPIRVLQGPKTLIRNPTGIYVDLKSAELWVANYGNHSATVYPLNASGDVAPLRVIRGGPLNAPAPMMSNPHAVAYDSKRDEILVAT